MARASVQLAASASAEVWGGVFFARTSLSPNPCARQFCIGLALFPDPPHIRGARSQPIDLEWGAYEHTEQWHSSPPKRLGVVMPLSGRLCAHTSRLRLLLGLRHLDYSLNGTSTSTYPPACDELTAATTLVAISLTIGYCECSSTTSAILRALRFC